MCKSYEMHLGRARCDPPGFACKTRFYARSPVRVHRLEDEGTAEDANVVLSDSADRQT
jgi:hypothetical protein